ncbi:MAG: PH domain-containing protein [Opitutaceae bacterium]|nr:PH domain-containing protein [Opitutaceae bacterium]
MNPEPASAPSPEAPEIVLWHGSPSQWTNLGSYFLCLLLAAAIGALYLVVTPVQPLILAGLGLPALWALCRWIATRTERYELTSERIRVRTGFFSRTTHDLELYRVRDYSTVEPFWLRLVGVGHVILTSSDRSTPQTVLRAVPRVAALKDLIRIHTEHMRRRRGVRDLEIDPHTPPHTS